MLVKQLLHVAEGVKQDAGQSVALSHPSIIKHMSHFAACRVLPWEELEPVIEAAGEGSD